MIKIGVKRVFKSGKEAYKLEAFRALLASALPDAYLCDDPHCYLTPEGTLRLFAGRMCVDLKIGDIITRLVFEQCVLPVVEACGDNLKNARTDWTGPLVFTF